MVRNFICATALLAALVASSSFAQAPGGGGRGQRGGFGGPGGGRGSATMLLAVPEVQAELGLTDDQKTQLKAVGDDVRKQFQSGGTGATRGTRPDFQNMTDDERNKMFADMRARFEKITKSVEEKTSKILTAEQSTRLKQLQLQAEGSSALTSPDVVAKLKLTDDQKAKITKILEDARSQRGQGGFDRNQTDEQRKAASAKRSEQRAKTLKDALAVLDDDQLVQWGEMRGKDFKFPENMGFGGRGGNRGGRGGNRGGNGGSGAKPSTPAPEST